MYVVGENEDSLDSTPHKPTNHAGYRPSKTWRLVYNLWTLSRDLFLME